jgi:hypothetical protein
MSFSLKTDGITCLRATTEPLEEIVLFGERSSGTNVTRRVIRQVFGLRVSKEYGWKHGAPAFLAGGARTLFVVSLRDPFDWCVSMYAKPYHAGADMRSYDFDTFIRAPWMSVMDAPRQHGLKRNLYLDQVLQPDRHVIEGRPYRNLMEMRTVKMRCWLGLLQRGVNVAILRHERLQADPEACLAALSKSFGLTATRAYKKPHYMFDIRPKVEERRAHAKARLAHNMDYIRSQLDPALEAQLGYDLFAASCHSDVHSGAQSDLGGLCGGQRAL